MTPIPTVWWLRPVSKAARVGAHRAVVWNRLYFRPFPASRSAVGVAHGPPNTVDAANPTSSSRTTSTFGAPAGGSSGSIAGNVASGSLASRGSSPSYGLSGIGRTSRKRWSVTLHSFRGHTSAGLEIGSRHLRTAAPHHPRPGAILADARSATIILSDERLREQRLARTGGLPDCRVRILR